LEAQLGKSVKALRYGSFNQAYRDLEAGRIDAVIQNIVSLSLLVNEKPELFALGQAVEPRSYAAWAVKKGNQVLLDYLNQFMASVRASGELKRLQKTWLKSTFDLPDQPLLPGDRPIPTA
jgi:polar amino acid transport system substrate-binding protein